MISSRWLVRDLLLLLILSYTAFWWNLGKLGLIDPDEPFYALSAREMVQSGDWLTPQIFGAPQFEKPIFYYWMLSGSYRVFGESEFAGRFPTAASATVLVLLAYAFARRLFNPRAGLLAGMFMTGGLVMALMGRLMLTDIPLAVFITASLYAYWRSQEEPQRRNRWIFLHMFFSALGVLTKGPIGSLIPLFSIAAHTILARRPWALRGRGFWSGLVAYAAIVGPWYTMMLQKHGWSFVDEFFYRDNWLRFIRAEHASNNHFWYYPAVLLIGSIPWLPALLMAIRRFIAAPRGNPALLFTGCWLVPNLLFLTAAQSKLPSYAFFLFVPLALLTGMALDALLSRGFETRAEKGMVLGAAGVQAVALVIAPFIKPVQPFGVPVWVFGLVLVAAFGALMMQRYRTWIGLTAISSTMFIGCALTLGFPALEETLSIRPVAQKMAAMQRPGEPLLAGKFALRGIAFYTKQSVAVLSNKQHPFWADHPVKIIVGTQGLSEMLEQHPSALCTMRRSDWKSFSATNGYGMVQPEWIGENVLTRAERRMPQKVVAAQPGNTLETPTN